MADEQKKFITQFDADMTSFRQKIQEGEKEAFKFINNVAKKAEGMEKSLGTASAFRGAGVYNEQTKQIEKFGNEISKTSYKMKDANGITGIYTVTQKKLKDGTTSVTGEFKRASTMTESYGEAMNRLFKRALLTIPVWMALRLVVQSISQLFKSSVKFLIDWEYQLAQIAIVGNSTKAELKALSGVLLQISKDFGISNKELGESSKLWAQQGRSMEEIIPLMRTTAQLSLLTGQTTSQSVEDLTAVLKAYKIEARDSLTVVDTMTNVMLNHAITAQDLASAYKQVASTASSLGVSFASLTGYITAIKAVTRDSGSKVGLTLRTMFSRITTSSAKAIQNLASIPLYLDETGRTTFAVTPRLRDLDTIISELSLKFNSLGNAQKSQLANLIGGVRRQNQVFALFDNFTEAVKAQTDALFGLGKSSKAIETLTNTAKISIDKLKNTWFSFVDAVASSEVIINILNSLRVAIEAVDKVLASDKFNYKVQLDALNKQNDEYSRTNQYVNGIKEIQQKILGLDELRVRATKDQLKEIDEQANIYRKAFNEASKLQGVTLSVNETGGLNNLTQELNALNNQVADLNLQTKVNQELNGIKTNALSTGQIIGKLLDKFSTALDPLQGKFNTNLREIARQFQNLQIIPDSEIDKIKQVTNQFMGLSKEESQTLVSLMADYQENVALVNDKETITKRVVEQLEQEKKTVEDIVLEYEKTNEIKKLVLEDEIERLQQAGALGSEILKQKQYLEDQFGIEKDLTNRVKDRLALERELSKEKRLQNQNQLGSEALKLFEIAKTSGVDVARQLSDVLAGTVDFSSFIQRGGEAVEIFKKQFADIFEQQQAMAFFKGNTVPGAEGLRGGFGIDIAEGNALRFGGSRFNASAEIRSQRELSREQDALIGRPSVQNNLTVPVEVGVNVSVDPSNLEEMQEQVEDRIAKKLPEIGSKVNQGLAKALYNKQTGRV